MITLQDKKDYIDDIMSKHSPILQDADFQRIYLRELDPNQIDLVYRRLKNLSRIKYHEIIRIDRIKKKEEKPSSRGTNVNYNCYVTAMNRTK